MKALQMLSVETNSALEYFTHFKVNDTGLRVLNDGKLNTHL